MIIKSDQRISFIATSIVEVSMNKIALWISVGLDDWTGESGIIFSNETENVSKPEKRTMCQ